MVPQLRSEVGDSLRKSINSPITFVFSPTTTGTCYDFFYPSTTLKNHKGGISNVKFSYNTALKLQIGKDDDKKESKYQKYIYYASKGYQCYGESGQDTNTKVY
jgi:hypothetical protein